MERHNCGVVVAAAAHPTERENVQRENVQRENKEKASGAEETKELTVTS
jgi:hypothetical protein